MTCGWGRPARCETRAGRIRAIGLGSPRDGRATRESDPGLPVRRPARLHPVRGSARRPGGRGAHRALPRTRPGGHRALQRSRDPDGGRQLLRRLHLRQRRRQRGACHSRSGHRRRQRARERCASRGRRRPRGRGGRNTRGIRRIRSQPRGADLRAGGSRRAAGQRYRPWPDAHVPARPVRAPRPATAQGDRGTGVGLRSAVVLRGGHPSLRVRRTPVVTAVAWDRGGRHRGCPRCRGCRRSPGHPVRHGPTRPGRHAGGGIAVGCQCPAVGGPRIGRLPGSVVDPRRGGARRQAARGGERRLRARIGSPGVRRRFGQPALSAPAQCGRRRGLDR